MRAALSFELLDAAAARHRQPPAARRIAISPSQRRQATLGEALLIAPQGAGRIPEGGGHVVLIRPATLDQAHHGMGLGHRVVQGILSYRHPRHSYYPAISPG